MPYWVRENLYIGNITDAAEILLNGSVQITHLLSVLSSVSISFFSEWKSSISIPAKEIREVHTSGSVPESECNLHVSSEEVLYSLEYAGKDLKVVRMAIALKDTENENLLDYLEACLNFIDEHRKHGSVLVNCFAGVSRSAAVITAYLMRAEELLLEDALRSLRQCCPFVFPNDGFMEQLKLFEEMCFKVDHASPIYKQFHLKLLGDSYNSGKQIDMSKFSSDPGLSRNAASPVLCSSSSEAAKELPAYRCKKCRRVVALEENIVGHIPGTGDTSFAWHRRSKGPMIDKVSCTSLFVEPLQWMTSVKEGAMEGKLACVHCDARLGYFNWSGIQCSCGSWITPAFQIHKNRVDESTT